MALTDKLTAIANAIRTKSGKTNTLTLDQMPIEIEALSAEEQLKSTEYPSYITPEVLNVVNNVRAVQKDDSITFIAVSDSHYPAEQTATSDYTNNKASSIQANKAIKSMAYLLDVDFVAHLGDVSTGAGTTTPDMLKSQIEGFLSFFKEAKSDIPVFLAVGNHDGGIYYHEAKADGTNYCMTGEYLYDIFTSQSASDNTVFGDTTYGGYCYRDFTDKKLRVFLLNTSEGMAFRQTDSCTLAAQRLWFANALLDLNTKSDATDWGFVVLCHYPADYGGTMPLSELFKAYVMGGSITITGNADESFTSTSVSFSGKNSAKFIAQFHGHVHNFKTSKLYSYATGSGVQYDAWRMCIPNCQYNRENYYSTVGSYTDINFAEDISYNKTADTADGTTFVVNVINPSEEKIYSFCYGAGYDRVIGYGATVYYSVTSALTNVTNSNEAIAVEAGMAYSATLTPTVGSIKTVTVTMGGTDITATAHNNGVITIPEVTGDIVITATAQLSPLFTNLVPLSIDSDGSDYYVDGDGFARGQYISSSGSLSAASTNLVSTGFIPVETGVKTIRIAGENAWVDSDYTRFGFYDSNFTKLEVYAYKTIGSNSYYPTEIEEDATILTIQMDDTNDKGRDGVYMRICTPCSDDGLIVTVDEEIIYGGSDDNTSTDYVVTQNLTNVSSSNTSSTVTGGSSFTTTLTANDGYELENVTVTMGGVDVTSTAYSGGVVTIASVTGNVVITANAVSTSEWIGQNLKGKTVTFTLADISNAFDDDIDKQVFYIDDNNKIEASENGATGHYYAYTDIYFGGESMGGNDMRSGSITYTFPNDVDAIVTKHNTEFITIEISDSTPSVSYTNQLPISTDTDGSIYNGIGYKENLRLSSSGEPSGQTNSYITGFIPYKYGDVVYLENVTFQSGITNGTTSSNQRLSFYDANKTHLGQTNATAAKNVCGGTLDANSIYTSFTTNASTKNNISTIENVAYFRLNATYIGADSIITVNEPIE